jgi:hypothetical protein
MGTHSPLTHAAGHTWEETDLYDEELGLHGYTARRKLGRSIGYGSERAYKRWTVTRLLSQRSMASVAFYHYHTASPL